MKEPLRPDKNVSKISCLMQPGSKNNNLGNKFVDFWYGPALDLIEKCERRKNKLDASHNRNPVV